LRWNFDKSVLVCLLLFVALLVGSAALGYWNTSRLDDDARRVAYTHEVLDLASDVLRNVVDAETGMLGYFIVGNEDYLQPYEAAMKNQDKLIRKLDEKTADNPDQQKRILRLRQMAGERMATLSHELVLQQRNEENARAHIAGGKGKAQMDAIRLLIAEIRAAEDQLLVERRDHTRRAYIVAQTSAWLTAALGLVLGGVCYGFLRGGNRRM